MQGGAASYDVNRDGTLAPVSGTVRNGRSDTCWIQDGDLRAFSIGSDGSLTLVQMLPLALPSGAIGVTSS